MYPLRSVPYDVFSHRADTKYISHIDSHTTLQSTASTTVAQDTFLVCMKAETFPGPASRAPFSKVHKHWMVPSPSFKIGRRSVTAGRRRRKTSDGPGKQAKLRTTSKKALSMEGSLLSNTRRVRRLRGSEFGERAIAETDWTTQNRVQQDDRKGSAANGVANP